MEFEENEGIKYQHPATLKGKEGQVYITTLRIAFFPHQGGTSESLSFTWANVKSVEYTPANDPQARAIIRLGTVLDDKKHLIFLVHPDKDTRLANLETVKGIISDIRKPGSSTVVNAAASSGATQSQSTTTASSAIKRKEYDMSFGSRGHSNGIWASIATVGHDGSGGMKITITPETKMLIFQRFPAVKRAFAAEVSTSKMSEKAFWEAFYRSQYFTRPQDTDIISSDRRLFTRHELPSTSSSSSSATTGVDTTAEQSSGKKRLRDVTELEVDLTASMESRSARPSSPTGVAALDVAAQLSNWVNADSTAVLNLDKEEVKSYLEKLYLLGIMPPCEEIAHADDKPEAKYSAIKLKPAVVTKIEQDNSRDHTSADGLASIVVDKYDPQKALASLPTSTRSKRLWDGEVNRVMRNQSLMKGQVDSTNNSLESIPCLDTHSRQEIRELFEQVTEVARHFYHNIRNAESATAAVASGKADANIKKLGEIGVKVEHKKQKISHSQGHSEQAAVREHLLPIWSEMLKIVKRATDNWDRMRMIAQGSS